MKIPNKVKIGGHLYKVEFDKTPKEGTNRGQNCGGFNRANGVISINDNLIKSEKEETFIHEILHGMNSEFNETVLDSLAQQIYQVLKDNNLLR